MKPFLRPAAPGYRSFVALGFLLLALSGCGRHASRPASMLSEKDRTLLDRYEEIRAALAVDDLRATKRAGLALSAYLKKTPDAAAAVPTAEVETISTAVALDKARLSFQPLSVSIIKLADGVEGYYIFDTPIPAGAEWVQKTAQSDNPYTGKAMHDIGTLRK